MEEEGLNNEIDEKFQRELIREIDEEADLLDSSYKPEKHKKPSTIESILSSIPDFIFLGSVGSALISPFIYGLNDAQGNLLPYRGYIFGGTLLGASVGLQFSQSYVTDNLNRTPGCMAGPLGLTIIGAVSYALGGVTGNAIKLFS